MRLSIDLGALSIIVVVWPSVPKMTTLLSVSPRMLGGGGVSFNRTLSVCSLERKTDVYLRNMVFIWKPSKPLFSVTKRQRLARFGRVTYLQANLP